MTYRSYLEIMEQLGILMLLLLVIAVMLTNVEGGGNGDWPYSGSGDWTITTETHVWDETIVLDGNLDIMFADLYFEEGVTLSFTGQNREINVWIEEFHVYNSTIEGEYPVTWTFAGGSLFLNHTTVGDVDGTISLGQNDEWIMHSSFIGDDEFTTAFEVNADNILFLNNTFTNFTDHGIGCYSADSPEIRENTFVNVTTDLILYDCTNVVVQDTTDLWYLSVTLLDALRRPISAGNIYLFDRDENALSDHVTASDGTISWILIDEADSPITIVAEKYGNLAETTVSVLSSMDVTLIMRDYIPTATFHVHFFNSFTGLGEDAELLKVYYRVNSGAWVRTSGSWSLQHALGTLVEVRIRDYYDMLVSDLSVTLSNVTDYHLDVSVPLATVHLEDTLGLNEFTIIRQGSGRSIGILGTEFRVIADFEGNSTILYTVSWRNTTLNHPENGSEMHIGNGSFSFSAEASDGDPYILQNVGTYLEPMYDAVFSPSSPEWWESRQVQKYLVIAGIVSAIILPITMVRTMEWWKRKLEKKARRERP